MKRILIITIPIIIVLIIALGVTFSKDILSYFYAELFEIRQTTKYGPIGKDTVAVIGDGKFQIMKASNELVLIVNNNETSTGILNWVCNYKKTRDNIYIYSLNGYATVDGKTNTCRLFYTKQPDKRVLENVLQENKITVLTSFDEFTIEERGILNNLQEAHK